MTKRIKHVSELPDWFRLEKYEGAKNLTAVGWYQQIDGRYSLARCGNYHDFIFDEEPYEDNLITYFDRFLKVLRDNPIIDIMTNDIWKDFEGIQPFQRLFSENRSHSGIRSISLMDYALVAKTICPIKLETAQQFWDHAFNEQEGDYVNAPSYGNESIYKLGNSSIRFEEFWDVAWIDLGVPDNLLIEDFKNYLKHCRESMSVKIEDIDLYKNTNFQSWYRLGVLPFIDLNIWAREQKTSIPYRVMADAIFVSGDRGEETIRKTTRPLTQFLLTDISRKQLESLAIAEMTEQKKK